MLYFKTFNMFNVSNLTLKLRIIDKEIIVYFDYDKGFDQTKMGVYDFEATF